MTSLGKDADEAASILIKVSQGPNKGFEGAVSTGAGMGENAGAKGAVGTDIPQCASDPEEAIGSPDADDFIIQSCRDINNQFGAPDSPFPRNMTAPANVECSAASGGDKNSCSPTPVWQDTQSQSVIGNEIVTQDFMVSQQLRDEEARQLLKRKVFREKLINHERKKRLKLPEGQAHAENVSMQVSCPEEAAGNCRKHGSQSESADACKATGSDIEEFSSQRKAKKCVRKVKNDQADPIRRSPRIATVAARQRADRNTKVGVKRARFDIHEPGGVSGDCTDFVSGLDGINVSVKKGRRKVGSTGPKKRKGKAVSSNAGTSRRLNVTVRCSLGEVSEAVALLKPRHESIVRNAGFGCVFDWVLKGNVSRLLICYLMKKIDTNTMRIDCGPNKVLTICREAVHQVFGFPMGDNTAPRPADSGHDESMVRFKSELGFSKAAVVDTKDLRNALKLLVEDISKDHLAVKVFFAILFSKMICPGPAVRIGREAGMLDGIVFTDMATMDFCQLVVDELKRAAVKWQDPNIIQAGPEGCGVLPVVMYLDCCFSKGLSVMHVDVPRANFLTEKLLSSIYLKDIVKKGGKDLDSRVFGKLGWKSRNQIAYCQTVSIENPVPNPTIQSEPGGSHIEPEFSNMPKENNVHKDVVVFAKIDDLLRSVNELAAKVPKTSDRMGFVAGICPEEHAESEDIIKEATARDAAIIGSLLHATSHIRNAYTDLKKKQDAFCKDFKSDDRIILSQINNQSSDHGVDDLEAGQVDTEAAQDDTDAGQDDTEAAQDDTEAAHEREEVVEKGSPVTSPPDDVIVDGANEGDPLGDDCVEGPSFSVDSADMAEAVVGAGHHGKSDDDVDQVAGDAIELSKGKRADVDCSQGAAVMSDVHVLNDPTLNVADEHLVSAHRDARTDSYVGVSVINGGTGAAVLKDDAVNIETFIEGNQPAIHAAAAEADAVELPVVGECEQEDAVARATESAGNPIDESVGVAATVLQGGQKEGGVASAVFMEEDANVVAPPAVTEPVHATEIPGGHKEGAVLLETTEALAEQLEKSVRLSAAFMEEDIANVGVPAAAPEPDSATEIPGVHKEDVVLHDTTELQGDQLENAFRVAKKVVGSSAHLVAPGNPAGVTKELAAKLKDIVSKERSRPTHFAQTQKQCEEKVEDVGADGSSEETESDDFELRKNDLESSQTVSTSYTPATPEAVQRMKDLFHAVLRLRKDRMKKDVNLFDNDFCKATIGQVAESFRVGGMMNTAVAAVGIHLLHCKYKGSTKMVAPFHISRAIWKGSFDNRHLIKFFSANAEEPLDKKEIVLFGVFDPPSEQFGCGHYCVVALNLKHQRFELLDSYYGPGSEHGIKIINLMARNIKQLWKTGSSSRKKNKLSPENIDHFRLHHAVVPQQENPTDCGFFMVELLETYDGESHAAFSQDDMYMVRVQNLYRWITCGVFDVNVREVLGYHGNLGLDEPKFSLFESQCQTPEIHVISDEDILKSVEVVKVKKGRVKSKKAATNADPKAVEQIDGSDEDDFMPVVPKKGLPSKVVRSGKPVVRSPISISDDDFVCMPKRKVLTRSNTAEDSLVVSNKRPVALSTKLRMPVPAHRPSIFPHQTVARKILNVILSQKFIKEHGSFPLFKCTPPDGEDEFVVDANYLITCFGPGGCIDTELMDLVINYWKGCPDTNHVYKSGERVLLSPYVITYLLDIDPYPRPTDSDGQIMSRPAFNTKLAARRFKAYIKEDLLGANLIMLPYWNQNHFTLYTMNKYKESLDIHDSWRYSGRSISKSRFHGERTEIMARMTALMKEFYGEARYNQSKQPDWEQLAERCTYSPIPEQGDNECGFYMLKAAELYDGLKLVRKLYKRDQRSVDWKAECLFYVLFHPINGVRPEQWPKQLSDCVKELDLVSQSLPA